MIVFAESLKGKIPAFQINQIHNVYSCLVLILQNGGLGLPKTFLFLFDIFLFYFSARQEGSFTEGNEERAEGLRGTPTTSCGAVQRGFVGMVY